MASPRLTEAATAAIEIMRKRAWDDFYYFAKYVLGNDLMEEQPHRELCDLLVAGITNSKMLKIKCAPLNMTKQLESLRKLVLWPRGAFKSTVGTQAFSLWLLWHNPDLRILIDSETLGNAKIHLAGIKGQIVGNQLLRLVCTNSRGEYLLEPDYNLAGGFVEDQVFLKHRTKVGLKEPSLFCSGVDNARTGMHVDVILMDDLVSERNVGTAAQIDKTYDHYKLSRSLLDPGGLQVIIGTRYHMADMYGQLIALHENDKHDDLDSMSITVRPAEDKDGKLFFPARLTKKFLGEQKRTQGSYIFSCQYMLSPIDEYEATFRRSDVQLYDRIPDTIVAKYIAADFIVSPSASSDFFAAVCIGVDTQSRVWVLDYIHEKCSVRTQIDYIIDLWRKMNADGKVRSVGVEVYVAQKALKLQLQEEMRRCGVHFKVIPLTHGKSSKEDHIMTKLQPIIERQELFVRPHMVALLAELEEYPRAKNDDLLDALAYAVMMLNPRGYFAPKREYRYTPASVKTGY